MDHDEFIETVFDRDLWNRYVQIVGVGSAKSALVGIKVELKDQRRARVDQYGKAHTAWLASQARFEAVISARLRELEVSLAGGGSSKRLRQRITELTDLIGNLSRALDGTEMEHLLDDFEVPFGDEWLTLGDALDEGRFRLSEPDKATA